MNDFLLRMKSLLGDEFDEFLKFYNSDDFIKGLRVNTLKCLPEKLCSLLDFELKKLRFAMRASIFRPMLSQSATILCTMQERSMFRNRLQLRQLQCLMFMRAIMSLICVPLRAEKVRKSALNLTEQDFCGAMKL